MSVRPLMSGTLLLALGGCAGSDGGSDRAPTGPAVADGVQFTAVSAGGYYTCGLTDTGDARCWGDNFGGQLGTGTSDYSATPALVAGGLHFASVSATGLRHACGLTTSGAAYCWGEYGLLGTGELAGSLAPVAVAGGHTFTVISSGSGHSCALTPVGDAYCWGNNVSGALGNGVNTGGLAPVPVTGGHTFISISAGGNHTCAIATGGAAYCWGMDGPNGEHVLGVGATPIPEDCGYFTCSLVPLPVTGGITFTSITASRQHTCGLAPGGAAYCWGTNTFGQLGDGTTVGRASPVRAAPGMSFVALSTGSGDLGDAQTCGLTSNGTALCWGFNERGQLGNGTTTSSASPVPVAGGHTYAAISVGRDHVCGLTTDRVLYCWGGNSNGSLGTGTTERFVTVPTRVAGQQ